MQVKHEILEELWGVVGNVVQPFTPGTRFQDRHNTMVIAYSELRQGKVEMIAYDQSAPSIFMHSVDSPSYFSTRMLRKPADAAESAAAKCAGYLDHIGTLGALDPKPCTIYTHQAFIEAWMHQQNHMSLEILRRLRRNRISRLGHLCSLTSLRAYESPNYFSVVGDIAEKPIQFWGFPPGSYQETDQQVFELFVELQKHFSPLFQE